MLAVCIGVDAMASSIAWYFSNSAGMTHQVKGKLPNDWGLYDVCGNVWEWTFDSYLEHWGPGDQIDPWLPGIDRRVVRGTSFYGDPGMMRSANRGWRTQTNREWDVGFRCVKSL
jgi:formylglycine-generating enzyme required for sulfatase activity